ncbi:formylmethanofuran dehydrogenase subunit E family protein [Methanocella conradii]|uniref:formylmethanofuran dehydrogenase subunit E family protein n=1 Tax=Methanocella conradii TaxID=1175444 RepID=UPI00157C39FE|nr:formylmethanofuran dehydrogenase subunit E family protein [Methanocella conradii]
MHDMGGCKYTGLDKDYTIEDLAAFHGHLGPYIVLGYRMGRYVRRYFCMDPFKMNAVVYCSCNPPQSCIADGVQIGSGCTLGKRNIELVKSNEVKCEFLSDGKKLVLRPVPIKFPPKDDHHYSELIEQLAVDMYRMDDTELFSVSSR